MDGVDRILEHVDHADPGRLVGVYLHGSAVSAGLRPTSDVDLLLLTRRSLNCAERRALTEVLLEHSGGHLSGRPGRPLEVTAVVLPSITPWRYPPTCDYQFGEWLRAELSAGALPRPHESPDLAIVLCGARTAGRALRGPDLTSVLDPVPARDLRRAVIDSLPALLADLDGDERNVVLTLARMVVTLDTGRIVSKGEATRRVAVEVGEPHGRVLEAARRGYLGVAADDWSDLAEQLTATVTMLADLVRRRARRPQP